MGEQRRYYRRNDARMRRPVTATGGKKKRPCYPCIYTRICWTRACGYYKNFFNERLAIGVAPVGRPPLLQGSGRLFRVPRRLSLPFFALRLFPLPILVLSGKRVYTDYDSQSICLYTVLAPVAGQLYRYLANAVPPIRRGHV